MIKRKAFTMIELIMVIVILGIVASMGASIIATMYKNYIRTIAINKLQTQSEIVLEQIAKRLSYRIKGSAGVIREGNIISLREALPTDTTLTWISKSNESYLNRGWSGFIDLDSPDTNRSVSPKTIKTPASNLNATNAIVSQLTNNTVNLTGDAKHMALIMKTPPLFDSDISRYYSNTDNDYTIKVQKVADKDDVLSIVAGDNTSNYISGVKKIYEQYSLAHSAYTIVPEGDVNDFNLTLKYNFQPWEGESWDDENIPSTVLAEHVSTFRFLQRGNVIRLKLCIHDNNQSANFDFSACKETAVF